MITTGSNRAGGWWRLCNPVDTRRPPALGSQPEVVIGEPKLPTLLINDDWCESARLGQIEVRSTDGTLACRIMLWSPSRDDPDHMVFLAHPNRLYVRARDRAPQLGMWLPDRPTREVAEAEHRTGQTIRKAQR